MGEAGNPPLPSCYLSGTAAPSETMTEMTRTAWLGPTVVTLGRDVLPAGLLDRCGRERSADSTWQPVPGISAPCEPGLPAFVGQLDASPAGTRGVRLESLRCSSDGRCRSIAGFDGPMVGGRQSQWHRRAAGGRHLVVGPGGRRHRCRRPVGQRLSLQVLRLPGCGRRSGRVERDCHGAAGLRWANA